MEVVDYRTPDHNNGSTPLLPSSPSSTQHMLHQHPPTSPLRLRLVPIVSSPSTLASSSFSACHLRRIHRHHRLRHRLLTLVVHLHCLSAARRLSILLIHSTLSQKLHLRLPAPSPRTSRPTSYTPRKLHHFIRLICHLLRNELLVAVTLATTFPLISNSTRGPLTWPIHLAHS